MSDNGPIGYNSSPQESGYYAPQPPQQEKDNDGVVILVLGILGFFVPIASFVAWFWGNSLEKDKKASGVVVPSELRIGKILGMVSSIFQIIMVILIIIMFIFLAVVGASLSTV